MSRPRRLLPSWHAGTRAQVEWAARSRWRRVPASAGARHFRGRRHLPLLGHRRRGKPSEIDARCAELPPHPPCARPSHPARPTHGSRTFPPLRTAHAPPCTPRLHLTPVCPRVRRSSILPFYLDQGRERCAEAARRRRRGPYGPGGRFGAQGGCGGGRWGCAEAPPRRQARLKKRVATVGDFFLCHLWANPRR